MIAYLALFFALTGTAMALPGTNSVDSGDIINGQISRFEAGSAIMELGKDIGTSLVVPKNVGVLRNKTLVEETFLEIRDGDGVPWMP